MTDRYLARVAGKTRQKEPITVSTGTADAGRIIAAGADGKLHDSFMGAGSGANIMVAPAF